MRVAVARVIRSSNARVISASPSAEGTDGGGNDAVATPDTEFPFGSGDRS